MSEKKFIVTWLLVFGVTISKAQPPDTLKQKYINQTITRYGSYFLRGSERLVYKDLQNEFKISELALASFQLAKKNRTTSIVYRSLSLASAFAVIGFVNRNRNLSYAFIGGQAGFMLLGARHTILYNQHLDRAIWQYNKDALFPEKQL